MYSCCFTASIIGFEPVRYISSEFESARSVGFSFRVLQGNIGFQYRVLFSTAGGTALSKPSTNTRRLCRLFLTSNN